MLWIGGIILILAFVAIIKKYEPRMTLFLSGLIMYIISGQYLQPFDMFAKTLVSDPLVPIIVTSMGFAFVMTLTECDKHFSCFAMKYIIKMRSILVPGTVIVVWFLSNALTSPAGIAAAVGPIAIPVLIRAGIHPAIAGSTVLLGSWGAFVSVGSVHLANICKLSGTDVPSLVVRNYPVGLLVILVCGLSLMAVSILRKENKGYQPDEDSGADGLKMLHEFEVNYVKAVLPVVPIILLILGSKQIGLLPALSVAQAMMICTILTYILTRPELMKLTKEFYAGMGEGFGFIVSLIAAAAVFTGGMTAIGLTDALVNGMKSSTALAKITSSWGTFFIAALSGSGDAATLAYNNSITPHAADFGMAINQTGTMAFLGGVLGRSLSPVAGVCIICAQIAHVNPLELSKRVAPGVILANVIGMITLLWMY